MAKLKRGTLVFREKLTLPSGKLRDAVIWKVPRSDKYPDGIRYRLALVDPFSGEVIVLFDNHYPKGHHEHRKNGDEVPYKFISITILIEDYLSAIKRVEDKI